MATHRPVIYRGAVSKRPLRSDERVSAYINNVPPSQDGDVPVSNPRPEPASNYGNPRDSAIDTSEVIVFPDQPTHLVPDQETDLQDELFSALIPTHQDKRGFFAKDQLSKILTEDRVRSELTRQFEDSLTEETIADYAKTICHGDVTLNESSGDGRPNKETFIKVLAICIIIEKTNSIVKLLEEDVNDAKLPLVKVSRPNNEKLFDLRIRSEPNTWTTLPVEFDRPTEHEEVRHYQLQEQRILPFIKDSRENKPHFSRRTELEGGFASVFKVAIHPQHHNFHASPDGSGPEFFAVKRLHSQNKQAFQREVEMLNKFSGNKHEHLISLLATYEQFDQFFLMFDWAEADLQSYWRNVNPEPSVDLNTVLWMAGQCKGIASGIIKIHSHVSRYVREGTIPAASQREVFGHHGDIKPENVLWFDGPCSADRNVRGTLKLSDFGLAEVSVHRTISMAPKSKWGVSLGYRAPETDLNQGAAIGRSYDIWTLGCLYLEFITWMLGGSKLLDDFLEARKGRDATWHDIETHTFFKLDVDKGTGEPKAVIKPRVTEFIRKLHSHPKCSQFIHDFLYMVEGNMLVVKTNNRQRIDRFEIGQVHYELASMLERCESDIYAISPVPSQPHS